MITPIRFGNIPSTHYTSGQTAGGGQKASKPKRNRIRRGLLIGVLALSSYLGRDVFKPSVWQALHNSSSYQATPERLERRSQLVEHIQKNYIQQGDGKIDWYEFADIVEHIAQTSDSDEQFRRDLWDVVITRFKKALDNTNTGLPPNLHNRNHQGDIIQKSEQMHHYIGGVTGNTWSIPSHLLNNEAGAYTREAWDATDGWQWNAGDIALFDVARTHRNEFLKKGRFVVAQNIRSLLTPR
jgi:hypothetical protein